MRYPAIPCAFIVLLSCGSAFGQGTVTAHSTLSPSSPDTPGITNPNDCNANSVIEPINYNFGNGFTCMDPVDLPTDQISVGIPPFSYVSGNIGTLSSFGPVGYCMCQYVVPYPCALPAPPQTFAAIQPNPSSIQACVGASQPQCVPVTFSVGATLSLPTSVVTVGITAGVSTTIQVCGTVYGAEQCTAPASCSDNPATATCPINTVASADGTACVCPAGTLFFSDVDFCCASNFEQTCGGGTIDCNGNCQGGGGGGQCGSSGDTCGSDSDCCSGSSCVNGSCQSLDPIVIDLSGAGFLLTTVPNGVVFDFDGPSEPTQMAWTQRNAKVGFLALDRNGDGKINDGAELFGNLTPQPDGPHKNGFRALAVFDQAANGGNGDGQISSEDAIWPRLRVWIDTNHDGVSEPAELFALDQVGIRSISLSYTPSHWTDAYGNIFRYQSQLTWNKPVNGKSTAAFFDVLLQHQ